MDPRAACIQWWDLDIEYLHFRQQERQSKGLWGQVSQSGPHWAGETVHTHSGDIKHSIFKQITAKRRERQSKL